MTPKVRFAPSPTGHLHVGNARTALLNWLFARRHGGIFLLRMDDTDISRSTPEFERDILEDLAWLGLDHDEFFRQSERQARYDAALEALKQAGRLYPCYETAAELSLKRKVQLNRGRPPVYDRAALSLTDADRTALEAEGRRPHWRFRLLDEAVAWEDLGRGPVRFEPGHLSDPVLVREDGRPLYTLTSVVDDGESGITHVIRGEDHVVNTAAQVQLFAALGFAVPQFAHLPLMVGADGKSLSKRLGSLSLRDIRAAGTESLALFACLARLGTPEAPTGAETRAEMAAAFDLTAFGRASPRYDANELATLNGKVLAHTPYAAMEARLREMGVAEAGEDFWLAVRENITVLADAAHWGQVCFGNITTVEPGAEDRDFLRQAAGLLPQGDWSAETWGEWTAACKAATGRKGKALFLPLRRALTGRDSGPELRTLLPFMGYARVAGRLG